MEEVKNKKGEVQRGNSILAFKAGIWYTAGNFLGRAITLITTPIFARLMSVSDYGEFFNFSNWTITIMLITGLELRNTLSKAYYDFKEEYDDYISAVTFLGGGITVLVYTIFILFPKTVLKIVSIPEQYIPLLFLFAFFNFSRGIFYARERTLYRYKTVAVITFISLFVPTLISIFLVYVLPETNQLSARLYGFYVPSIMISMYCTVNLFMKSRAFRLKYCRYALVLSIPLLFHYLTAHLLISTNIVIAKNLIGASAAAIISIAGSTTHIFTILTQSMSGALTTWFMDNLELRNIETLRKGSLYYVSLLASLVIFAILLSPEIVFLLGGDKYKASVILLPCFLYSSFIQAATSLFTIILTYDKNVVGTAVFTGVFAVLSIIAKVFLLPDNGLIILAYVNVVAFGALYIINYVLVKKAGYADTINFRGMFIIILLTGAFVMIAPYLYQCNVIRYALISAIMLFLSVTAVKKKRNIIDFVRKIKHI